jgi:hypothetical protein
LLMWRYGWTWFQSDHFCPFLWFRVPSVVDVGIDAWIYLYIIDAVGHGVSWWVWVSSFNISCWLLVGVQSDRQRVAGGVTGGISQCPSASSWSSSKWTVTAKHSQHVATCPSDICDTFIKCTRLQGDKIPANLQWWQRSSHNSKTPIKPLNAVRYKTESNQTMVWHDKGTIILQSPIKAYLWTQRLLISYQGIFRYGFSPITWKLTIATKTITTSPKTTPVELLANPFRSKSGFSPALSLWVASHSASKP